MSALWEERVKPNGRNEGAKLTSDHARRDVRLPAKSELVVTTEIRAHSGYTKGRRYLFDASV